MGQSLQQQAIATDKRLFTLISNANTNSQVSNIALLVMPSNYCPPRGVWTRGINLAGMHFWASSYTVWRKDIEKYPSVYPVLNGTVFSNETLAGW